MADTTEMAPSRAKGRSNSGATSTKSRSRSRRRDEDIEVQIERLQQDLKGIASTMTHMAERGVGDARNYAESEVRNVVRTGKHAVETVEDEFGDMERQLKDTIRRKPLTAVAGAVAIGFVLALISR